MRHLVCKHQVPLYFHTHCMQLPCHIAHRSVPQIFVAAQALLRILAAVPICMHVCGCMCVQDKLRELVQVSAPGDVIFFHFSGHGTQVCEAAASQLLLQR